MHDILMWLFLQTVKYTPSFSNRVMTLFSVLEPEVFGTLELKDSFIWGIIKAHKNEILFWSNKKTGNTLPLSYLKPNFQTSGY